MREEDSWRGERHDWWHQFRNHYWNNREWLPRTKHPGNTSGGRRPYNERSHTVGERRWEEVKEQQLAERYQLPKRKKDARVQDAIDVANKAINDIKVNGGRPLTQTDINQIVYSAALIITEQTNLIPRTTKSTQRKKPLRKENMEKEILRKRSDVSVLSEMQKGSRIRGNRENQIKKRYNIKCVDDISVVREKLKQQIQAKAQRIRRFEKRNNFSRRNKVFKKMPKSSTENWVRKQSL